MEIRRYFDPTTGINSIEFLPGESDYFDLNDQRMANRYMFQHANTMFNYIAGLNLKQYEQRGKER